MIVPQNAPSDERIQSYFKEEDEDDTNTDNDWSMSKRHKKERPGNKRSSYEVANCRKKYEVLESDSDDHEEDENKD